MDTLPHELVSYVGDYLYIRDRVRLYVTCSEFYGKCYASDSLCAHSCKYNHALLTILSAKYKIKQPGVMDTRGNVYEDITSRRILCNKITYYQFVKMGTIMYDRLYIKNANGEEYCMSKNNQGHIRCYNTFQENYDYERFFNK